MTTKRIVYTRPDGGVSVVTPDPNYIAGLMAQGMTEEEAVADVRARDVPVGSTNVEVMEAASLPGREFRNAWEKLGAGPPTVNMPKAKKIHAGKITRTKEQAVTALQTRADKATLEGRTADAAKAANDKAAVEGLNLTTTAAQIAGAANPTALSAIWPVELREFRP